MLRRGFNHAGDFRDIAVPAQPPAKDPDKSVRIWFRRGSAETKRQRQLWDRSPKWI